MFHNSLENVLSQDEINLIIDAIKDNPVEGKKKLENLLFQALLGRGIGESEIVRSTVINFFELFKINLKEEQTLKKAIDFISNIIIAMNHHHRTDEIEDEKEEHINLCRMPGLEIFSKIVSSYCNKAFSLFLQKSIDFYNESFQIDKFKELICHLPNPISIHIFQMPPLLGQGIVFLNTDTVNLLFSILFGMNEEPITTIDLKHTTLIEKGQVNRILRIILKCFEQAFSNFFHKVEVKLLRSEMNSMMAKIVMPDEDVVLFSFDFSTHLGDGTFGLCLPLYNFAPFRSKLLTFKMEETFKNDIDLSFVKDFPEDDEKEYDFKDDYQEELKRIEAFSLNHDCDMEYPDGKSWIIRRRFDKLLRKRPVDEISDFLKNENSQTIAVFILSIFYSDIRTNLLNNLTKDLKNEVVKNIAKLAPPIKITQDTVYTMYESFISYYKEYPLSFEPFLKEIGIE